MVGRLCLPGTGGIFLQISGEELPQGILVSRVICHLCRPPPHLYYCFLMKRKIAMRNLGWLSRSDKNCFKLLGRHLEQSGYEYTPETADEWFRLIEPDTSVTYANFYRSALIKLRDIYETGDIRDCNNGKIYAYIRLHEGFKNIYEEA